MITWMQKHRKTTMATMWIAVVTFIGAGAVGWGDAKFGSAATSIGKVGSVELKGTDFNQMYSQYYDQYNQMMGGKLDKEMAQRLRIQETALKALEQQAQFENLAKLYDISITDAEVTKVIHSLPYTQKAGKFDKATYLKAIKTRYPRVKNFEEMVRKQLKLERLNTLLKSTTLKSEQAAFDTIAALSDKIRYKKITSQSINVKVTPQAVQSFWEINKKSYKTQAQISVDVITQKMITTVPSAEAINAYFDLHSMDFQNANGEMLTVDQAKDQIILAINKKETKNTANRLFIAWKNGKLSKEVKVSTQTFAQDNAPYDQAIMQELLALPEGKAMKAREYNGAFVVLKLVKLQQPRVKTFKEAKPLVTPHYVQQEKRNKLLELATKEAQNFKGTTTKNFVTVNDVLAFTDLNEAETKTLLRQVFTSSTKKGQVTLSDDVVVVYEIMAQKLLFNTKSASVEALNTQILQLKEQIRKVALAKALTKKYPTQMYN